MRTIAVSLDSLVGEHELSGVDFEQVRIDGDYSAANVIRFVIDGKIYVATEDPDDGYRSSMRELVIVEEPPVTNVFGPVKVVGRERGEVIEFVDAANSQTILEVGTDNSDDYYPSFVNHFYPDRMAINAGKSEDVRG
jgi:hypothetical protein